MKLRLGFVSNSSSSCFICNYYGDTKILGLVTVKMVKEKLETLLGGYNKLYESHLEFDQVFAKPKIASKADVKLIRQYFKYDEERIKERQRNQDILGLMLGSHLPDYKPVDGRILIYSAGDNSIPSELFELIENYFDAVRIHLG